MLGLNNRTRADAQVHSPLQVPSLSGTSHEPSASTPDAGAIQRTNEPERGPRASDTMRLSEFKFPFEHEQDETVEDSQNRSGLDKHHQKVEPGMDQLALEMHQTSLAEPAEPPSSADCSSEYNWSYGEYSADPYRPSDPYTPSDPYRPDDSGSPECQGPYEGDEGEPYEEHLHESQPYEGPYEEHLHESQPYEGVHPPPAAHTSLWKLEEDPWEPPRHQQRFDDKDAQIFGESSRSNRIHVSKASSLSFSEQHRQNTNSSRNSLQTLSRQTTPGMRSARFTWTQETSCSDSPDSMSKHNSLNSLPGTSSAPSNPRLSVHRGNRLTGLSLPKAVHDLASADIVPHLGEHSSHLMPRIKTIELYRKNAKKSGDPEIQFQFSQYLLQTALMKAKDESEEDKTIKKGLLKEAIVILKSLAEHNHPESEYLLGDLLFTEASGKPDYKQSFSYFYMAAKHGNPEAAYRVALCFQEGWGTQRDANRALRFLKSAGAKNQPGALYRLGVVYFYGYLGVPDNLVNRQTGIKWLVRAVNAATEVYNQAPYELAKIYEVGFKDIVFADLPYAVKLYVRSAELNFPPAAAKLGHAYEFGELGCPQDAALSIHYYTIAALAGHARSQLSICAWYLVGAGPNFPKNEEEAFEWAKMAANNGLPRAQCTMGFLYENGIGCTRDVFQSTSWYQKAAHAGDERAIAHLSKNGNGEVSKNTKDCIIM